jgi:hypothetical protein
MLWMNIATVRVGIILMVALIALLLGGCQIDPGAQNSYAEALGNMIVMEESQVYIDSVEVEERTGEYYLVVQGSYPDSCTKITDVTYEVADNTVTATLSASRPSGIMCSQALVSFEEEFLLDVEGLEPGEYTIEVNGVSTTFAVEAA